MLVPSLFAFGGLLICGAVALWVIRTALVAMSPTNWSEKWVASSFITFAWHEVGRGLFYGLLVAAGLAPLTVAFFAGSARPFSNITFLSLLSWAAFAAAIFLIGLVSGTIGFLRYEAGNPERHSIINLAQLAIVAIASVPIAFVFMTYLVPSLVHVVGLWLDTMGLYAELAS